MSPCRHMVSAWPNCGTKIIFLLSATHPMPFESRDTTVSAVTGHHASESSRFLYCFLYTYNLTAADLSIAESGEILAAKWSKTCFNRYFWSLQVKLSEK